MSRALLLNAPADQDVPATDGALDADEKRDIG
jgi:hypothetical protein